MQGAVDDDRLQFWQFLVTIALLSVAGLSVVTVVLRRSDRLALLLVAEFSAAIFAVAAAPASTSRPPATDLTRRGAGLIRHAMADAFHAREPSARRRERSAPLRGGCRGNVALAPAGLA